MKVPTPYPRDLDLALAKELGKYRNVVRARRRAVYSRGYGLGAQIARAGASVAADGY